ncbi:hypothetical protein Pfo_011170 [Paulownia fortunei]|nr:hypothetical protein Pfo_011170 [Paulownia fortunei]
MPKERMFFVCCLLRSSGARQENMLASCKESFGRLMLLHLQRTSSCTCHLHLFYFVTGKSPYNQGMEAKSKILLLSLQHFLHHGQLPSVCLSLGFYSRST